MWDLLDTRLINYHVVRVRKRSFLSQYELGTSSLLNVKSRYWFALNKCYT